MSPPAAPFSLDACRSLAADPRALIAYLHLYSSAGLLPPPSQLPPWLCSMLLCDAFRARTLPAHVH